MEWLGIILLAQLRFWKELKLPWLHQRSCRRNGRATRRARTHHCISIRNA